MESWYCYYYQYYEYDCMSMTKKLKEPTGMCFLNIDINQFLANVLIKLGQHTAVIYLTL